MNNNNELYHFGILGMKWGVRRFQRPDGTLTSLGKQRRQMYYQSKDEFETEDEFYDSKIQQHEAHLGKTTVKKVNEVIDKIEKNIRDDNFADYKGYYSKDVNQLKSEWENAKRKQNDLIDSMKSQMKDKEKTDSFVSKLPAYQNYVDNHINKKILASSEYKKSEKEVRKAYASYKAKSVIASKDWMNETINDLMNDAPKNRNSYRAEIFDLATFGRKN